MPSTRPLSAALLALALGPGAALAQERAAVAESCSGRPSAGSAEVGGRVLVSDMAGPRGLAVELTWEEVVVVRTEAGERAFRSPVRAEPPVDETGRWGLCAVPSGVPILVEARSTGEGGGLRSASLEVSLEEGENRHLTLVLGAADDPDDSMEIEGLTVEVRRGVREVLRDAGVRMETLGDRFIAPEAVRRSLGGARGVVDLVERQNLPGVGVLGGSPPCVYSRRYRKATGAQLCARVVVDGVPTPPEALGMIPPGDVEAIALLRAHEAGGRWGNDTAGGILFIWTRGGS